VGVHLLRQQSYFKDPQCNTHIEYINVKLTRHPATRCGISEFRVEKGRIGQRNTLIIYLSSLLRVTVFFAEVRNENGYIPPQYVSLTLGGAHQGQKMPSAAVYLNSQALADSSLQCCR
jgi:hypothetical protein